MILRRLSNEMRAFRTLDEDFMSSKNNPELRGAVTELRKYNSKAVKPCRIIDPTQGIDFIGAAFENGDIVMDTNTKRPIPYQAIYG